MGDLFDVAASLNLGRPGSGRIKVRRAAAGIVGAIAGIVAGQGVAVAIGDGPYLAFAVPLVLATAGALLLWRRRRGTAVGHAAVGFAVGCGMLLLLFVGAN